MTNNVDYTKDFIAFFRDLYIVDGAYGPQPVIPPFLEMWLRAAFPLPAGDPVVRNVLDARSKKEGKSALAGAVALYMATRAPNSEVIIAAADVDQATDRVLRSVKYACDHGPLGAHAKVLKNIIELDNGSFIQAIPADWKGAAGGNPSAVIFDELHAWTFESQRRLFDELVIPPTVNAGVRWMASYAGWTSESVLLEELWNKALAGERYLKNTNMPFYHNQAASLLAFIDTGPDSWRMPWMTKEYIDETRATERPNTFRRLWLNEWTSNESQFVTEEAWNACYSHDVKPLQEGERVQLVLGADGSTSRDYTSLVGMDGSDVRLVRVWKPQKIAGIRFGKPTIDIDATIGEEVLKLHKRGQVAAVVADPFQLHTCILKWARAGIRVIEMPQTGARVEADQSLYDAINSQTIRHYNDPQLNDAIQNAVAIETPRGFRIAKEKTKNKIDAAVSLSMAHSAAANTKYWGSITYINNPWNNPLGDDEVYVSGLGVVHSDYGREHAEGVTWRNCKKRTGGCIACVEELEAEGFYQAERERAANGPNIPDPDVVRVQELLRNQQLRNDAQRGQDFLKMFRRASGIDD